ncbi:DEAD/DEAH box helicase [Thalassomonas haliotis]|uniref:DNA2/NAM7 helicase-like C-terminal domain-containing protein n=1 Tax=Thalassomonas haliotis TaxID=485448 RepID=A0ABY7V955_9GAMM|nr:AAA domain-containing protein [Thalassomonas haliotis]WDE10124.1 hypothetical protein H3N35_17750 [Thalassomonas haliotis]
MNIFEKSPEIKNQTVIDILTFWHQAEFFNSVALQDLAQDNPGVIYYQLADLINNPTCLPWLNRNNIRRGGNNYDPNKVYSYTLYLGVFQRSEFFAQAKGLFHSKEDSVWDEHCNDSGITCTAKIKVNKEGCLLLDTLELSTAPWALGQALNHKLDNISFDDFEYESEAFIERWQEINKVADNVKQETGASPAFTTFELLAVLEQLQSWAGFEPLKASTALIIKLNPIKKEEFPVTPLLPPETIRRLQQLNNELITEQPEMEADAPGKHYGSKGGGTYLAGSGEDEQEVAILNSFFIRDLELARNIIRQGNLTPDSPLARFLAPTCQRYADLLTPKGEELIREQLAVDKTPAGRWPGDSSHIMSLMQQFSINTMKEELADTGLYSVNGPPGTGKSTLLRDIIADNVVQRAKVLAGLSSAKDAFCRDLSVKVGDKVETGIKQLIPELCGFEMVVLSSNNNAVENISKELPQMKTLGQEFLDLEYFKPVAQKLAADHKVTKDKKTKQEKITLAALEDEEDCWGLVAAALGNYDNRKRFGERIRYKPMEQLTLLDKKAASYRTLSAAIRELRRKSPNVHADFKSAQKAFQQAEAEVEQAINDIKRLEKLAAQQQALAKQAQELSRLNEALLRSKACMAKLDARKAPWWSLEVRKCCYQRAIIAAFKLRIADREARLANKQVKYKRNAALLAQEEQACQTITQLHQDICFSAQDDDFNSAAIQRYAFGHSKELNRLRAELAAKAFVLHQAWVLACYNGCFSHTVNNLMHLINGKVKDYQHAKAMWQCFFMLVPVVSSAFASVASQFSALRAGDIGWLFIDEAGQATPQQAVGALLRAKRAIVVGDPLQIEPVFSTPPEFIEFFGKKILGEQWHTWSPTTASVQSVADRVNPYGTNLIATNQWLGSPLRVHRRCQNPMFSIANQIAYSNTMLHGSDHLAEVSDFVWGQSSWCDVPGAVDDKHFVPEQAAYVLMMLYRYIEANNELPACYIVTPFRNVKKRLKEYLKREFRHETIQQKNFYDWIEGRIGTIHTFQGKEEKYVIFVLGGSLENGGKGATNWASAKPNLLNVAVTRAKKRFYMVGCKNLWGGLAYFSVANTDLASVAVTNPEVN